MRLLRIICSEKSPTILILALLYKTCLFLSPDFLTLVLSNLVSMSHGECFFLRVCVLCACVCVFLTSWICRFVVSITFGKRAAFTSLNMIPVLPPSWSVSLPSSALWTHPSGCWEALACCCSANSWTLCLSFWIASIALPSRSLTFSPRSIFNLINVLFISDIVVSA